MQKYTWIILFVLFSINLRSELVDIGHGRKIFMECSGEKSPTVILVSGRSDRSTIWSKVIPEVAKFARVCAYDRPGTITVTDQEEVLASRSTSVTQPTNPKEGVEDLHALLKSAGVSPPYVLVGHSFGGLIVRLYASTYPEEVSGVVLVDTLTEYLFDRLKPEQQTLWIRLNSNYSKEIDQYTVQERTDFLPTFAQMKASTPLKPMPAVVLTSDQPYDFKKLIANGILPTDAPLNFGKVVFQAHLDGQKQLAEILHAQQINETHAGHYIQTEQPKLVIDAIRSVVEQARIIQVLEQWPKDFNNGKAAEVCGLFAPNLVASYPGMQDINYEQMCQKLTQVVQNKDRIYRYAAPKIEQIVLKDDFAVVRLIWTLSTDEETIHEKGMDLFQKQPDGSWKIAISYAYPLE